MNKLAVLAFALLLFFSTMLWYLANSSLNDYLKSQVILQSNYYSSQEAKLLSASYSDTTGITHFTDFSLSNIVGSIQPLLLRADNINAQLAKVPTRQLNSPSIQKKTTTIVHVEELRLGSLQAWSEVIKTNNSSQTNLQVLLDQVNTKLATDYPALYPQISAELYAKRYPERSEELALEALETKPNEQAVENNQAVIASNEAKQKKRLLGKAITRVKISSVIIDELTLTVIHETKTQTKQFKNIQLGSFGNENGLESNQMGGELLKQILAKLIKLENSNAH
ncbi:MAG TPA: hypothetical protein DEO86_15375 [Colwellia sp.]|nr:hypothetical protein [Colwellia sp.]